MLITFLGFYLFCSILVSDTSNNENNNPPDYQPVPSRNRSRNKESLAVNQRKLLRKEYFTTKGVKVLRKLFENSKCGCPKKCITLFTEREKEKMYLNHSGI